MARNPNTSPSNQNRPPEVPPRAPKPPMSKESKFIGYLVLGFGVLAVLTVLMLAFGGGDVDTGPGQKAPEEKVVGAPRRLAPELMPVQPPPPQNQTVEQELLFKRNPDFNAAKMDGEWQAMIGKYTAVLQIDNDIFQVILAGQSDQVPRLYTSGTFKVLEDLVMLMPRRDWPQPASTSKDIEYRLITGAAFPVVAYFDGEDMIWQNPPRSEKRVLVPRKLPLLMLEDQEAILWKRLK